VILPKTDTELIQFFELIEYTAFRVLWKKKATVNYLTCHVPQKMIVAMVVIVEFPSGWLPPAGIVVSSSQAMMTVENSVTGATIKQTSKATTIHQEPKKL
jgi:hypothetical protein